nr:MAG: internal scaffolding protein [Microvirus sp.]QJB19673.1 MAG: internal scaffolding protein [Microvirus sp.]
MEQLKFRTKYNPHPPRAYAFTCVEPSLTQQQFKDECDVNNILKKYQQTGLLSHVVKTQGNFGDFSSVEDYQTSLHKVMIAQDNFELLPSELRSKFNNDPSKLIGFINDPKNKEDCLKYGLILEQKIEPSIQVQMEQALEANDQKRSLKKVKET